MKIDPTFPDPVHFSSRQRRLCRQSPNLDTSCPPSGKLCLPRWLCSCRHRRSAPSLVSSRRALLCKLGSGRLWWQLPRERPQGLLLFLWVVCRAHHVGSFSLSSWSLSTKSTQSCRQMARKLCFPSRWEQDAIACAQKRQDLAVWTRRQHCWLWE